MLSLFLYRFLFPLRFLFLFPILVSGFSRRPMKAAFAARVNLLTQVAEAANFSYWSRTSRIEREAGKNIVSLQCFGRYQSAEMGFEKVGTYEISVDRPNTTHKLVIM